MNSKVMVTSFRNVALAGLYIFGISQFLFYGNHLFDAKMHPSLIPFLMLLLLCLSAAVVGSLVFGQAVLLFLDNKKNESIQSVGFSLLSLFLIAAIVAGIVVVLK